MLSSLKNENKKGLARALLLGFGLLIAALIGSSVFPAQKVNADNCYVNNGTYTYARIKIEGSGDSRRLEPACETPIEETQFGIYLSGSGNDPLYFYIFDRKIGDTYFFKGYHNSADGGITTFYGKSEKTYGIKVEEGSIGSGVEWFYDENGNYVEQQRTIVSTNMFTDEFESGSNSPEASDNETDGEVDSEAGTNETERAAFATDCNEAALNEGNCGIVRYLNMFINLLTAVVGVVVVIMIAFGGIQYSTARDDPQAVMQARTRIRNAIIALVSYLFIYAFLQWLIPGGVF